MSMMDTMMESMVKTMSIKKKEEMMLRLMPEMMKKADVNTLTANVLKELGTLITLYGVYRFISLTAENPVLKEELKAALNKMKNSMPEMMSSMMPLMREVMPQIMPVMMPMMFDMMKEMSEKEMKKCKERANENPEMKKKMCEMMFSICPEMAGPVVPAEKEQDKNEQKEKNGAER